MVLELNFANVAAAVARTVPDREALVQGTRRFSHRDLADRAGRLAAFLENQGLGCYAERERLRGHEIGQDRVAQYLHNGPEYLEGMFGAYRARAAPFNINYRYARDELRYLLADAAPRAIQYHARYAPALDDALTDDARNGLVLLQVDDGSGEALLPGAVDYEDALASSTPTAAAKPSPDDVYLLYTGGTTGMPKGVLWRQADIAVAACGLINKRADREWDSLDELVATLPNRSRTVVLTCGPLIHGAAQWGALHALCTGGCVVFPPDARGFDAGAIWDTVDRESVTQLAIVGDAFARELVDALERAPRDLPELRYLISGGAPLQPGYKRRLIELLPSLTVLETIGSSETGVQGRSFATGARSGARTFQPDERTMVVAEDRAGFLDPGHTGIGWLGSRGRVPLGYLGDERKTEQTFPVVDGVRVSLPGDRVRLLADGTVELLGRDAMTINSGGEKIFAEEVEAALKAHPSVADAAVCGRPSARWGSEVVAIVAPRNGIALDTDAITATCAEHLARYKLPKDYIIVERVRRTAAGKVDYAWAQVLAAGRAPGDL